MKQIYHYINLSLNHFLKELPELYVDEIICLIFNELKQKYSVKFHEYLIEFLIGQFRLLAINKKYKIKQKMSYYYHIHKI